MNQREKYYKDCTFELNRILVRTSSKLPSLNTKVDVMSRISQYIESHTPPMLYRYMPMSLNAISGIITGDIYMVAASKMNDIFEGVAFGVLSSEDTNAHEICRVQNEVYLKSFSYSKNNILMWSHYGDSHKGICVGYDFRDADKDVIEHLYPVQYSNSRFSNAHIENVASHPFLCLRKSPCWKYEKEFRLIYQNSELPNSKIINLNCNCIKEIQFGFRADIHQIDIVKSLVGNRNIKLYQTKQEEGRFNLTREEIYLD